MATIRKYSRYFDNVDSLALTPTQTTLLESLIPLVRLVTKRYYHRHRLSTADDPIVSLDDMVQMALVSLTRVIKEKPPLDEERNPQGYYARVVRYACTKLFDCNNARGSYGKHLPLDQVDFEARTTLNTDQIHDRVYLDHLLDNLGGDHNAEILRHYYGIDTPQIDSPRIAELLPMTSLNISRHRWRSLSSLRTRIEKGSLPCQTT